MPVDDTATPMTVAELRAALAALPDDAHVRWSDWDSEWGYNYVYGVQSVSADGLLRGVITDSWYEGEGEDSDPEAKAEADTADAASAETLYQNEYPEISQDGNPEDHPANAKRSLTEGQELTRKFPNGVPDDYVV